MAHRRNVTTLSIFSRYYFGRCSSILAQLVPLPYSRGRSTRYSARMSPFVAVTRMPMSTVFLFLSLLQFLCYLTLEFSGYEMFSFDL